MSSSLAEQRPQLWLRCEKKAHEKRAALTPTTAKKLIDAGFEIFVERDEQRIFADEEYDKYVTIDFFQYLLLKHMFLGLGASS